MKIEVKNVSKKFKNVVVVNNANATFESGNIYGMVGRNGSGKSVFLKMICAFYIPTSGEILQDGYNYIEKGTFPKSTRALIEGPDFIPNLTGFQNLKLLASIQNTIDENRILESLKMVNLIDEKDKKYSEYSLGMKQKLGIAQVIMENPEVMILDEPFNGIEEASVRNIKIILKSLKEQGKLIILTSHIKEDIEQLANEVYTFDNGVLTKNN